jgi:hypothetical protein
VIAPTNHGGNGHAGSFPAPVEREPIPSERTMAKMRVFLAALRETGIVRMAAEAAQIARRNHFFWLKQFPLYRRMTKRALRQAAEKLEIEARKRAIEGVVESTHTKRDAKGNVVSVHVVRRHSDRLLELLLKAHLPRKYRERTSIELSGKVQHEEMDHVRVILADPAVRIALERARDRACLPPGEPGDAGPGADSPPVG